MLNGISIPALAARARPRPRAHVFDLMQGALPDGLRLTRASPATQLTGGVIVTHPADQPRFATDAQGRAAGLWIEPAATNLLPRAAIARGRWNGSSAVLGDLSLNALGAFDGCRVASTGADWNRAHQDAQVASGQPHVLTLYYRGGSSGRLYIQFKGTTAAGSVSSVVAGPVGAPAVESGSAGAVQVLEDRALAGGPDRVVRIAITPVASGALNIGVGPGSAVQGADITVLAAMLTPGVTGGSYIATHGAPATRAGDRLELTRLSGRCDLSAQYGDGGTWAQADVALAPGAALPLPPGLVRRVTCVPR